MTYKKSLRKFRKGKSKMTTSINSISQADGKQYYEKVTDPDGNETFVAVTVPIGKKKAGKKQNQLTDEQLDAMINQAKEELKSSDKKTRKQAEKKLEDLYREKGYSKKAAKSTAECDAAAYRAELRTENDQTKAALANLNSEDKKTRKNAEKELEEEYQNALIVQGYSKKEAKKTAEQYIAESKAALNIDDEAQLKASEDLKNGDKKAKKDAEKNLEEQYKNKLITNGHYSEKQAEKIAEKLVKDDKYKIRFENRTTFDNKEEYKAARKEAKENGEDTKDLALLSKKERKFAAEHRELFYDEDGNYSSDKGKEYVRTEILQNQDYRAELNELDTAAEKYGSTRKVQGKLAKSFGAAKETDTTALRQGLCGAGITLAGAAVGAGAGYLINKAVHVNTVQTAAAGVDGTAAVVEDVATATTDVTVNASNVATTAGGVVGGIFGSVLGYAITKGIKDKGDGDTTTPELARQYVSVKPAEEEQVHDDIVEDPNQQVTPSQTGQDDIQDDPSQQVTPSQPVQADICVGRVEKEQEKVSQVIQPACTYKRKGGESWSDITFAKYGIKAGDKNYKDLIKTIKHDWNDISSDYTDIPSETLLYDYVAPDGSVYSCKCDEAVKGTLRRTDMSGTKRGSYGKAPQRTENVEQTNCYYRSGTKHSDGHIDWESERYKVKDEDEARREAEENGCEFQE